jgi:ribulose-bisphosphate carboxylase small chain
VRLTQGTFSFLPDLNDDQIRTQVEYCIEQGWAVNIEWTEDPHPRNTYWELWGLPLFDIKDPAAVMFELAECRKANTTGYIKMNAFDASIGTESCVHSFLVQRPKYEPGFYVQRTEIEGRMMRYTIVSHSVVGTSI